MEPTMSATDLAQREPPDKLGQAVFRKNLKLGEGVLCFIPFGTGGTQ